MERELYKIEIKSEDYDNKADSRRTLTASYIRRHPIKAELWSWLETTIEAVLSIVCIAVWFVLAVLATNV
jgi:hypothetical protein